MSRLGDLLRLERTRRGLSYKQAARLAGVSDRFLQDVESGKRIVADTEARRILGKMGVSRETEAEFSLDDIAATVDLQSAVPNIQKRAASRVEKREDASVEDDKVDGSIWLDALKSVLRRVPVYNAAMKEVGSRLLPVENGRIHGAPPDKVFYYTAPDDSLRGFRVHRGDVVLIVPQTMSEDGALMLLDTKHGKILRMVKDMPRFQIMLQTYDQQFESEIINLADAVFIGKAVRLEADLG